MRYPIKINNDSRYHYHDLKIDIDFSIVHNDGLANIFIFVEHI